MLFWNRLITSILKPSDRHPSIHSASRSQRYPANAILVSSPTHHIHPSIYPFLHRVFVCNWLNNDTFILTSSDRHPSIPPPGAKAPSQRHPHIIHIHRCHPSIQSLVCHWLSNGTFILSPSDRYHPSMIQPGGRTPSQRHPHIIHLPPLSSIHSCGAVWVCEGALLARSLALTLPPPSDARHRDLDCAIRNPLPRSRNRHFLLQ